MLSLHIDTARDWRGGQRQVFETVIGLRAAGQRAVLVAHPDGVLLRRMREGLDIIPLAPRSDVDLSAAWRLSRVLKATTPDVIHAHDSHAVAMAATALAIAAPRPRPPLVASRRSEFRGDRSSFSRWKYDQVDCFIATNSTIRDHLIAHNVPPDRVAVIGPGIDVERIQKLSAVNVHAEFYLPTHAPIVGNVAMLVPDKGHHHLIEAAVTVVRHVPDARFVIVGDGDLRPSMERQIHEHHLERHVFISGFRTDVIELTKGFDVYTSSALRESASMAILDAMAAARPVVATATGNVPELVIDGETGYVVPPRDPGALAAAIVRLLQDEGRQREMGRRGLARVGARFTLERMVAKTAAVYARWTAPR